MAFIIAPCILLVVAIIILALTASIQHSHGWKAAALAFPVIGVVIIGSLWAGARFTFSDPVNDIRLWQFQQAFEQISHPAVSQLLSERIGMGLLTGSSNHCDFFAGQLRWAPLTPDEIEQFYAGLIVPAAAPNQQAQGWPSPTAEITIAFFTPEKEAEASFTPGKDAKFVLPGRFREISTWEINTDQYPGGTLYFVFAFDFGYPPGRDMRCH